MTEFLNHPFFLRRPFLIVIRGLSAQQFGVRFDNRPGRRRSTLLLVALTSITILSSCSRSNENTEIETAFLMHDLSRIKALIRDDPGLIFERDEDLIIKRGMSTAKGGDTLLHMAAAYGEKDVAEFLLANGAIIDAKDNYGFTPLQFAVNSRDVTEVLLAHGAEANAKNDQGQTALDGAMTKDVAELLLAKGANVNARSNNGWTPLQWAAFSRRTEVVDLLREHGGK